MRSDVVTGKSRSPQSRRGGVEWAQRATARDVAALSGVSAQTVSRVANGAQNVKPETKQRVLDAMEKIGYRPNAAARSLRSGRSDVIGLVAHHMARTGEAHTAEAIATAAHASGYAVSLAHSRSGGVEDLNTALNQLRQDVAGLVVLGMEAEQIEQLVVPPHTPVVIADSRALSHPTLGIDQVGGAVLAVEHLLGLGHATVHFVSGPQDSVQSQLRESGWRQALLRRGAAVPAPYSGDWTPASGYRAGTALAEDPQATAVFCANDEMAAGLLRALHERGRQVPDEISVVGFDDVLAEYLWPPLTTVHQGFTEVGERLVDVLRRQIEGQSAPAGQTLSTPELSVRASTAAPVL